MEIDKSELRLPITSLLIISANEEDKRMDLWSFETQSAILKKYFNRQTPNIYINAIVWPNASGKTQFLKSIMKDRVKYQSLWQTNFKNLKDRDESVTDFIVYDMYGFWDNIFEAIKQSNKLHTDINSTNVYLPNNLLPEMIYNTSKSSIVLFSHICSLDETQRRNQKKLMDTVSGWDINIQQTRLSIHPIYQDVHSLESEIGKIYQDKQTKNPVTKYAFQEKRSQFFTALENIFADDKQTLYTILIEYLPLLFIASHPRFKLETEKDQTNPQPFFRILQDTLWYWKENWCATECKTVYDLFDSYIEDNLRRTNFSDYKNLIMIGDDRWDFSQNLSQSLATLAKGILKENHKYYKNSSIQSDKLLSLDIYLPSFPQDTDTTQLTTSLLDKKFLEKFVSDLHLWWINYTHFSSGQKILYYRFSHIIAEIQQKASEWQKNIILLIDEPDLHLHLDRQRQYIQKLVDMLAIFPATISIQCFIATHSPFIISDIPWENVIILRNWQQKKYERKTFGANYIDLIRNGFFFDDQYLMWSLASDVIGKLAEEERKNFLADYETWTWDNQNIKDAIWDDFLKDNLLYFGK